MKGLLLKDFYMMKKYCRAYLLVAVVLIVTSLFAEENLFMTFYPCVLCGMIPVNLLAYDERSHWMAFSGTLPYTKAQIVSGKYLIGLLTQLALLLAIGLVHGIHMAMDDSFALQDYAVLMLLMLCVSTIASSVTLPFTFKLGVEKGRIAYYVTMGLVMAAIATVSVIFKYQLQNMIRVELPLVVVALICVCLYALSWYLSIVFYQKREI
ncbi:MAG: ABC-2 transporter permease [Ruminococcaceae bacterium]|nr:ABC-2 transporter permease [Oscillospiraceae bacterium]